MKMETESETEHRDTDDVGRLVGGLNRVPAPRNFERAVMTKIARGAPIPRRTFGWRIAVVSAVPALFLVAVSISFLLSRSNNHDQAPANMSVAGAASPEYSRPNAPSPDRGDEQTPPTNNQFASAAPAEQQITRPTPPSTLRVAPRSRPARGPGGGSFDEGVDRGQVVISQPNPQQIPADRSDVIRNNPMPLRDIFTQLGITAQYSGGWVVRGVAANSQAERSGVKPGDIVVAIGDTPINANSEFRGQFAASTIRVSRNGKELELGLR
jgi:hypothetical protein